MQSAPALVAAPVNPNPLVSGLSNEESPTAHKNTKLLVLERVFGHKNFRGKQEEAIDTILNGNNCLIVLPTGGGKSVCYSVPGLISGSIVVIICPLISLMMDQVNFLRSKGLNVTYINSSISQSDKDIIIHNLLSAAPEYNFLFLTPETATSPDMLDVLAKMKLNDSIAYIVVDECHCIDMWGFDFRPAYANLGLLTGLNCQVVALTATCTSRTEEIILSSLSMHNATVIRQSCDRPNIAIEVKPKKGDGKDQVIQMVLDMHKSQCGIIYCLERSTTLDIAYLLQKRGVNATYYHGALDPFKKKENFQAWLDGKALVMCATIAFGMGINKPDARFVIHHSISQSMDCYVQEIGRAGRDGEDSRTYMLFRFEDRTKHLKMISALEDSEHRVFKIKKLNEIVKFCIIPQCRRVQITEFFGEQGADKCGTKCDFCLGGTSNIKEDGKNDALTILQCLENMQKLIPKVTLHNLVLTFRGSKRKEVLNKNLNTIPEFGKGKERFSETGLKHFIQLLISDGVITETLPGSNETSTTPFLVNGNRTNDIINGKLDIWKYI